MYRLLNIRFSTDLQIAPPGTSDEEVTTSSCAYDGFDVICKEVSCIVVVVLPSTAESA